jgi:hypothetical protein
MTAPLMTGCTEGVKLKDHSPLDITSPAGSGSAALPARKIAGFLAKPKTTSHRATVRPDDQKLPVYSRLAIRSELVVTLVACGVAVSKLDAACSTNTVDP